MKSRWITITYYIDLETGSRIEGRREVEENYTIIRKKKTKSYETKRHIGRIEYAIECIRNRYKQGELF